MTIRLTNRLLAILLAVTLVCSTVVVMVEAVAHLLDVAPVWLPLESWAAWLAERRWADLPITATAAVTVMVGLLLVVLQLLPRRPTTVTIATADGPEGGRRTFLLGRRSLERHLRQHATDRRGVVDANSRVRRRRTKVDLTIEPGDADRADELRDTVAQDLESQLAAMGVGDHVSLRVTADVARSVSV